MRDAYKMARHLAHCGVYDGGMGFWRFVHTGQICAGRIGNWIAHWRTCT